ncbi:MAG: tRNA (guanosine(46)-N7)-methyltransferase TrmB [Desulfuromonadales bacterium]
MTQRMIEITSPVFVPEEALQTGLDPVRLFGADRPLVLEIGCGLGDFIIQLAQRRPDRNFLAIDIYNKGCLKTCKRVEAAGLLNVRVLRLEARYLLERYLGAQSLAAVYINCPDPWPKKRHRRRRLVNEEFLANLIFYLQPSGDFYFSSDVHDYAAAVAQLLPNMAGWKNALTEPLVNELPDYPLSKYMDRFLAQNLPIYFVHYRKAEDMQIGEAPAAPLRPGFRLAWKSAANE